MADWCNGNIAYGVGGLRFDSRAGQIRHSVADGSPPLRFSLEFKAASLRRYAAEIGPASRYMLRRITASVTMI